MADLVLCQIDNRDLFSRNDLLEVEFASGLADDVANDRVERKRIDLV